MNIQTIAITDLKPAPYNPRITLKPGMPAYERLARSLDQFSLVQPIIWNKRTGYVVGGHQRLAVLQDQGITEIPCVVVDLPEDREKALNIALNNGQIGSDWDPDKLIGLLNELCEVPDLDATLTGFEQSDLRELLLAPEPDTSPIDAEDEREYVDVTLEIPRNDWGRIESWCDALLAAEPSVRVHVSD